MSLLFLTCVIFVTSRAAATLPTWNMHYVCGQTISKTQRGGVLIFDADLLPAGHQRDCRVVIQPALTISSSTTGNYVLFHFSNFEVGKHCKDTNLTVYDGNGVRVKEIQGLKNPMCGVNSSLTKDVAFTTQSSYFTVVFRRGQAEFDLKSEFNLTFFSFSEGYCGDDDDDDNLFSCDNNRCIDNQFICQSLNPCGDNSDCPYLETSYRFLDFLGNIPLIVGAIFVILFCVGFFKKWRQKTGDVPLLKSMRHSASELVGNMIDGCRGIERSPSELQTSNAAERIDNNAMDSEQDTRVLDQDELSLNDANEYSQERRGSSSSDTSGVRSRTNSFPMLNYNTFSSCDGETGSQSITPSTYQEVEPSAPPVPWEPATADPPSYDEVMTNANKYKKS